MEQAPKIVTERLQAAILTTPHPDADVLTAFSEHTLAERERSIVVAHLAFCSECREVVALALPAEETAAVAGTRPVRNRWLTWPRIRWALVAAGVVTLGSVSLLHYQRKLQPSSMALYDARPSVNQETEARNQPVSSSLANETSTEERKTAVPASTPASAPRARSEAKEPGHPGQLNNSGAASKDQVVAGTLGGLIQRNTFRGQQLAHGPKMPNQYQQNWNSNSNYGYQAQSQAPAPSAPPAFGNQQASSQLVILPPAPAPAPQPAAANQKQDVDALAVAGRSMAPLQTESSSTGAEIARAKPASNANAPQSGDSAADALTVQGSNFSPTGSLLPESARWAISSTGGLQRSMDQGQTWQDVDVNAGYGRGAGMGLQMSMKSRDKALAKKSDAKEKPVVFRAVAANGPDVWAGGSEGRLYHSTDSGAHWARVLPSWRGIDLTGDIINLQFADPQHGRIVTSSAEIWTSVDAGQTWEKR